MTAGIVDAHTHVLPREMVDLLVSGEGPASVSIKHERGGELTISHDNGLSYPIPRVFADLDAKLEQMDRDGIEVSIASTSPSLFFYWLDPSETADICRMLNDAAAKMAADSGGRIFGMATVPMNDPVAAAAELRRARVDLGMVGVAIGTSVGSRQLDSRKLDPFFEAAARLGMPLLLHPYLELVAEPAPGARGYHLANVIASPVETLMAASRLIVGGVLDRHPELRFLLPHGGGAFPFHLGRLDKAYEAQPETRAVAKKRPSEYLENFLFDTIVFDSRVLRQLIELVGAERLLYGTNIPLAMANCGDGAVRLAAGEAEARLILGANARRAFRLPEGPGEAQASSAGALTLPSP